MKLYNSVELNQLPAAAITLVIIGVLIGVGTTINGQMYSGTSDSALNRTLGNSTLGLMTIASNQSLIGLIIIMGAVIAILIGSFAVFTRPAGGL